MYKLSFLKNLYKLIGPRVRKYLYLSLFIGVFLFCLETISIIVLQGFLVSIGIMSASQALIPSWYPTDVNSASIAIIGLGVLRASVIYLRNYSRVISSNVFLAEQRSKLFTYGLNFAHIESTQSMVINFTETINKSSGFISVLSNLLVSLVASLLLFGACLKLAPMETGLGLIGISALLIPFHFLSRNVGVLGKKASLEMQNVSRTLVTSFRNYFFLKLSNMLVASQKQMDKYLHDYSETNNKFASLSALKSSFPYFIGTVVVAVITLISYKYFNTESIILLNFFYLFTRAGTNFSEINSATVAMKFNHNYVVKLIELNNRMLSSKAPKEIKTIESFSGWNFETLEFKQVDFHYSEDSKIFSNLNFRLCKGEILLIKGESGVGKSTLVSLILGINNPVTGKVLLNGVFEDKYTEKISGIVGYVGPEPYLVVDSVRENLLYGMDSFRLAQLNEINMWEALEKAQIHSLILSFENKLDEVLNEHVQISTGQKQRISMARAFLKKPQLLIFDEATANLDSVTESKIIEQMVRLSNEGVSIVVISHKETFDKIATNIILMEQGIQPRFLANSKEDFKVH